MKSLKSLLAILCKQGLKLEVYRIVFDSALKGYMIYSQRLKSQQIYALLLIIALYIITCKKESFRKSTCIYCISYAVQILLSCKYQASYV